MSAGVGITAGGGFVVLVVCARLEPTGLTVTRLSP
jgi:hypothetical protein